jgi:hypothetical protein
VPDILAGCGKHFKAADKTQMNADNFSIPHPSLAAFIGG